MKKSIFITIILIFALSINSMAYHKASNGAFYSQKDAQWNFPNQGRGYCWASSYAMVISNLTEQTVTPLDIAYINSQFTQDTAICYHYDIAKAFSLNFEPAFPETSPYFKEFMEYSGETHLNVTSDEEMRAALMDALYFNPEGVLVRFEGPLVHTMVATHYDSKYVYFSDPAYNKNGGTNLKFANTYNGKNGYKLSDIKFIQALKIEERNISIFIDYSYMDFDAQPKLINGRVLVPMRAIFEYLGASVEWFADTKTVRATKDNSVMEIAIGNKNLYKDFTQIPLDVPAELIDGKTYVPVRAISEAFGYNVEWDSYSDSVYINSFSYDDYYSWY